MRKGPISLRLGFAGTGDDAMSYAIDLGLPPPKPPSAFNRDPEVETEVIWSGPVPRPAARLVERAGAALRVRDGRGWATVGRVLPPWTSMLTEYADPQAAPGQTHWGTVLGISVALLIGAGVLMASLAFSFQRYFEYQIEEARKISQ